MPSKWDDWLYRRKHDVKVDMKLVDINKDNIKLVRRLITRIFEKDYSNAFYNRALNSGSKGFNKVLKVEDVDVGMIMCRLERIDKTTQDDFMFWKEGEVLSSLNLKLFDEIPTKNLVKNSHLSQKVKDYVYSENLIDTIPPTNKINDPECNDLHYSIYISSIGVICLCQRRGLGEFLMEHIFQMAYMTSNVKCITLHVQTTNEEALKFYKKMGFKLVKKIDRFYGREICPSAYLLIWIPDK